MAAWVGDYSGARPGGSALKAAGCVGVVRYAGALIGSFNITRAEVADLQAHGLPVAVVCEQRTDDILGGRAVGVSMARAAVANTRDAGLPDGLVYAACDIDATLGGRTSPGSPGDVQMGKVADTLTGFADVLGWPNVGFYGSYYAIDWLLAKAVPVAAWWQTEAWSHGNVHPKAALLQLASPPQVVPRDVDFNDVRGDWHPRTGTPAPGPTPTPGGGMDTRTIQQHLHDIGFPIAVDGASGPNTRRAVEYFQAGYGRAGTRLAVDGAPGPLTQAALQRCVDEGGHLSEHFMFREFACVSCGWPRVHWSLPTALEIYRARLSPGGVSIVSGYRCPEHNAAIGGASNSQHLYGTAADVAPIAALNTVRSLDIFSGIEYRRDGLVYHVDTRAQGPDNTTGSSNSNPSVFLWG